MLKKDFNIDDLERYHRKKFEIISKIQDLRDLIAEAKVQEECVVKVGVMELNINAYDEEYSDSMTGFSEHIVKALEDIQTEYIKRFESIKIGD